MIRLSVDFSDDLRKELGRCIGCGACNIPCPMFHIEDLRETEGARARIKLLSMLGSGKMELTEEFLSYIFTCMNCGLCSKVCPVNIDVFGAIINARSSLIDMGYVPLVTVDMREARRSTGSPIGEGLVKGVWLPPDFQPSPNAEILYFAGCWSHTVPEIALASYKLLQQVSESVTTIGFDEPCCGGLIYVLGERDNAEDSKNTLIEAISRLSPKSVVSGCSLCNSVFPDLGFISFSSFIEKMLDEGKMKIRRSLKPKRNKIFLIPSCKDNKLASRILSRIKNIELLEVPEWVCCDCGATLLYSTDPDRFSRWLEKVTDIARDLEANQIVVEEPSCYSMIFKALGKNKHKGAKIVSFPHFLLELIT